MPGRVSKFERRNSAIDGESAGCLLILKYYRTVGITKGVVRKFFNDFQIPVIEG